MTYRKQRLRISLERVQVQWIQSDVLKAGKETDELWPTAQLERQVRNLELILLTSTLEINFVLQITLHQKCSSKPAMALHATGGVSA